MPADAQAHRFQPLLDAAADAMLVANGGGRIVAANDAAARLFGCTKRELLEREVETLIPERYRARHRHWRTQYARAPSLRTMGSGREVNGLRRDGTEFPAEVSLGPIDDDQVLVTVVDITERRHASETLRKFQRVIEQTASTVVITNVDGVIEYVNPRFVETTGYSAAEAIGQRPSLLKSGHTSDAEYRDLWRTITGGGVWHGEFYNRRKDGSLYWESAIISPVRDELGAITHFAGVKDDITARKSAEAAAREREELLRLFIEAAPVALAMFDREMRYLSVSKLWLSRYGLEGQALKGRSHYDVFPDVPPRWRDVHRRVLAGAVERAEEDRFDRADGTTRWVRWEARSWRDSTGEIGGIVIFSEDISERKRAELERERLNRELDRQRQLLETLVENSPVGLALTEGPEHRYALANPAQMTIARGRGELIGRSVFEVWPEAVGHEAQRLLDHVYQSGAAAHVTNMRIVLDRDHGPEEAYFNVDFLPLRDEAARVKGILIVSNETTEQVKTLRAIEQTELRFRATFDQAAVGIAHAAPDGRWLRVNEKLCEIVGYSREQLLQRSLQDITHPDDWEVDRALRQQLLAGKIDHYAIDKRCIRKEGAINWIRLTVSLLRKADGTPDYAIAVVEDIEHRKQAEHALRRLRGEMDQLLSVHIAGETAAAIAHELNQPLNAVASYTEAARRMLQSGNPRPERLMRAVEESAAQAQRAGRVMRELLQFLHKRELATEPVDLNAVVREALAIVEANGFGGFRSIVSLAPDLKPVQANRLHIEKVLLNLLRNAVEAMRDAGIETQSITITITTATDQEMALVTISDSGPGMDAAVARRIFDPFFTTKPKGLGMGLAICRALIEINGGKLWFDESVSAGATFHFTLPFAK